MLFSINVNITYIDAKHTSRNKHFDWLFKLKNKLKKKDQETRIKAFQRSYPNSSITPDDLSQGKNIFQVQISEKPLIKTWK